MIDDEIWAENFLVKWKISMNPFEDNQEWNCALKVIQIVDQDQDLLVSYDECAWCWNLFYPLQISDDCEDVSNTCKNS